MRAVVAVLAPKTHAGSAFGLFWVGSKLTGFAASIGFGLVYGFTDRPRDGIIVIFVQLVAGWLATCQPEDRRGSANDRAILQGGAVCKKPVHPRARKDCRSTPEVQHPVFAEKTGLVFGPQRAAFGQALCGKRSRPRRGSGAAHALPTQIGACPRPRGATVLTDRLQRLCRRRPP